MGEFCSPGDIWQCGCIFLHVTTRDGGSPVTRNQGCYLASLEALDSLLQEWPSAMQCGWHWMVDPSWSKGAMCLLFIPVWGGGAWGKTIQSPTPGTHQGCPGSVLVAQGQAEVFCEAAGAFRAWMPAGCVCETCMLTSVEMPKIRNLCCFWQGQQLRMCPSWSLSAFLLF